MILSYYSNFCTCLVFISNISCMISEISCAAAEGGAAVVDRYLSRGQRVLRGGWKAIDFKTKRRGRAAANAEEATLPSELVEGMLVATMKIGCDICSPMSAYWRLRAVRGLYHVNRWEYT